MRECQIILPRLAGISVAEHVEEALIARFAGFTLVVGIGAWRNPATGKVELEQVAVYTVGARDTDDTTKFWFDLVRHIIKHGNQEAVYVKRGRLGRTQIITRTQVALDSFAGDQVRAGL